MSTIEGLIRLIRPINCLMMGAAVLIGELIAYGDSLIFLPSLLGFATSFSLTGASMVANDYWDRFVDKINAPKRPIPSGVISVKKALAYAISLSTIGLITAYFTNFTCLIIALTALLVSLIYSYKGKETGLAGNFMVSAIVAIPLFYGGFLYKGFSYDFNGFFSLSIFALMAFLANTGREINKGIIDMAGDKLRNIKSLALHFGAKTAAIIAIFFYLFSVGLSFFPLMLGFVSWFYLPFVIISDLGFIVSSFLLANDYSEENAKRVKNMVLLWMLIGLMAFIAGGY